MPKKQAQRRIDKTAGSGARTITVTGGSTGGSGSVGQHSLSGSQHTGTLSTAQAPWAVTDTEFSAHTSNANAHHARQHSILSTSDHTVTAGAYSIVGAILDNTLGTLNIANSGDGIDVTKSGGTFTIAVDVSDIFGDGLTEDGSNNIIVRAGDGMGLVGGFTTVDEGYAFAWENDHTHTSTVGSSSFTAGFAGSGWRIDTDDASLELNDLTVRGQLSVYELLVRQIRATNGNVFVTDSAKIETVTGSSPYTLSVATDDVHGFAVGDLIRAQRFTGTGTYVCNMQVTSVTDTQTFVATLTSGSAPAAGMEFVRLGSTADSDRRGSIYLAASDSDAPFIDIIDGVDSFGDWNTAAVLKARFGNLAGVTDPDFGVLSGYGVYVKGGGYFKGTVAAANADVVIDETTGMNLQARTTSADTVDLGTEINWTTNPIDPASGRDVARMYAAEYSSGGLVYHKATVALPSDGSDQQRLFLTTTGSASERAFVQLDAGTTNRLILSSVGSDGSSGGELQLLGDNVLLGNITIRPVSDSTTALGTASYKFSELHVDTLYAGTTSSTDTGHAHDDRYYTEAEVDTLLSSKSDTTHTHAGYASSTHLHDDRYYTETEIDATLASYYTSSEIDTTLAGYSLVGHTHDSRYYTESETDALLATKAASSHTHDSRYYTESEVDALIAALPTSGHTHDDRYYTEAETDALLATKASTSHTHDSLTSAGAITLTHDTSNYVNLVDGNGTYARINATGIQSVIPAFSSGVDRSGLDITWTGDINARDITAVNLSTFTFERNQVAAVGTTLAVNSAGKPANEFALTTTGTMQTFDIADPESGSEQVFEVGDVVRISGMAYANVPTNAETASGSRALTMPFMPLAAVDRNQRLATAYLTITNADTSYNGYTRYTATYNDGPAYVAFLVGTGVVRWSGGMIVLTSDGDDYAPYIDVFNAGTTPWADGTDAKYVRMGRLDGLGVIAAEQYGIALGSDLDDSTAARIVASNLGLSLYKVGYTANDGSADTVSIASSGRVKFGTDISATATTAFDFNPATDSLTITAEVDLLDGSGFAADSTLYWQANVKGSVLEYAEATGGTLADTFVLNSHGLQLVPVEYNQQTLESQFRLEVGDAVLGFGDDTAGGYSWTPRIAFHDPINDVTFATLRTISHVDAALSGDGDLISTDLVAHPDTANGNETAARVAVASTYGSTPLASVGAYYREDGLATVEVAATAFNVYASAYFSDYVSANSGMTINALNSYFIIRNLPTSSNNLPRGAVWSNSGVLTIVS